MKELIKKRNLFMSLTLMSALVAIAFSFDGAGAHWLWSDNMPVAMILGILAIIFGSFWFGTYRKIKELR